VYVGESINRISVFDADGSFIKHIGTFSGQPRGTFFPVGMGAEGLGYIVSPIMNDVRAFTLP
jgi:hypothetical protein